MLFQIHSTSDPSLSDIVFKMTWAWPTLNFKMYLSGTATYTTNRAVNKTVVYNTWRLDNLLSLSEIEEIENLCGEMMGLYGYFKVGDNLENYKNFQTDFVDSESQFNLL